MFSLTKAAFCFASERARAKTLSAFVLRVCLLSRLLRNGHKNIFRAALSSTSPDAPDGPTDRLSGGEGA